MKNGQNGNNYGWKEIKKVQNEMEKRYEEMVGLKGNVEEDYKRKKRKRMLWDVIMKEIESRKAQNDQKKVIISGRRKKKIEDIYNEYKSIKFSTSNASKIIDDGVEEGLGDKVDDEMNIDEFMNDGVDETQSLDISDTNDHGYFNAFNSQIG